MTSADDIDCEGVTAEGGFGVGQVCMKRRPARLSSYMYDGNLSRLTTNLWNGRWLAVLTSTKLCRGPCSGMFTSSVGRITKRFFQREGTTSTRATYFAATCCASFTRRETYAMWTVRAEGRATTPPGSAPATTDFTVKIAGKPPPWLRKLCYNSSRVPYFFCMNKST